MLVRSALADLGLGDEERAFRAEVAGFLAGSAPDRDRFQLFKGRAGPVLDLYRAMGERGWLSLSWPEEAGGGGLPVIYEFLLWDEMAYARAARTPIGAGLVARSIVEWGTKAQKDRFLPGIRSGESGFSLGYSEPEAGSDLTSLRTRARRDGDVYVVSGEKRWTSDAENAQWLWLLCRTGAQEQRSEGLTLLVMDMHSPGVTITPISTLDGHRLSEVRLDAVAVPADHRIGPEGGAWALIRLALARERHLQVLPGRVERDLEMLIDVFSRVGMDDTRRDALSQLTARALAVRSAVLQALRQADYAEIPPVVAACNKVIGTELMQDIARTAVRLGDRDSICVGEDSEFLWRESIMETIAGGTTEMMLGVIARHGLRGPTIGSR